MTLKNETDEVGVPALDVDAMNELYLAMDLDHVQNAGYQDMLNEMVPLCGQAIDWKKSSILADHGTDTALRDLLEGLADKVKDIDMVLSVSSTQKRPVSSGMCVPSEILCRRVKRSRKSKRRTASELR